jgi:UDP-N-acetylmuramoyl-tripeptide--D-alanyl-D-alanine ligase
LGRHEVWNAALAIGVVVALGLDPEPALAAIEKGSGVPGRLQWFVNDHGVNIIDDTYNANPASTEAALETLVEVAAGGRTIAVLGDMLELGPDAIDYHRNVARYAADLDIDLLFSAGRYAGDMAREFGDSDGLAANDCGDLLSTLKQTVQPGDWVLVKGSRGMRMERAVAALMGPQQSEDK